MEEDEEGPAISIFHLPDVHEGGEGNVLDHVEEIGESEAGEDGVCGGDHSRPCENDEVEEVEDGSENTDQDTQRTMKLPP